MSSNLLRIAHLVAIDGMPQGCRDANDDAFIETARKGQAEYLVTFDRDLLESDLVSRLEVDAIKVFASGAILHELRRRGIVIADTVLPPRGSL